jgi:hypothetical protein
MIWFWVKFRESEKRKNSDVIRGEGNTTINEIGYSADNKLNEKLP